MAYLTQFHSDGTTEVDSVNPIDFGVLNKDNSDVSEWELVVVKTDSGLVTSGNMTTIGYDTGAGAASGDYQFAPWTTGDTTAPQANALAYGAELVTTASIDATTGSNYWVRRRTQHGDAPGVRSTEVLRSSATVIPAA